MIPRLSVSATAILGLSNPTNLLGLREGSPLGGSVSAVFAASRQCGSVTVLRLLGVGYSWEESRHMSDCEAALELRAQAHETLS